MRLYEHTIKFISLKALSWQTCSVSVSMPDEFRTVADRPARSSSTVVA